MPRTLLPSRAPRGACDDGGRADPAAEPDTVEMVSVGKAEEKAPLALLGESDALNDGSSSSSSPCSAEGGALAAGDEVEVFTRRNAGYLLQYLSVGLVR